MPALDCAGKTDAIRAKAKELLTSDEVGCVIGYEVGPRGRTRPTFVYSTEEADRLVWNPDASNNLTSYLPVKLKPKGKEPPKKVAVVVKPCDSRAVNVLLAENQFARDQVHVIGVTCEGVRDGDGSLQARCQPVPSVPRSSTIHLSASRQSPFTPGQVSRSDWLEKLPPRERMEFWLSQFDRCIRCYACRQACPMCNCPTCLYERDDSTFIGHGHRLE